MEGTEPLLPLTGLFIRGYQAKLPSTQKPILWLSCPSLPFGVTHISKREFHHTAVRAFLTRPMGCRENLTLLEMPRKMRLGLLLKEKFSSSTFDFDLSCPYTKKPKQIKI